LVARSLVAVAVAVAVAAAAAAAADPVLERLDSVVRRPLEGEQIRNSTYLADTIICW